MPPVYRLYALRGLICGQHVQWLFVRAGLFFKSCTLLLKSSNLFLLPKKSLLERIIFIALAWHFAPHATESFCQPAAGGVRDWIRAIHGWSTPEGLAVKMPKNWRSRDFLSAGEHSRNDPCFKIPVARYSNHFPTAHCLYLT